MAQAGFPSRFCLGFFTAPNQHRLFRAWLGKRRHLAPSPFPVRCSHIHSKTACRGFKSFCPCQKTGENTGFSPVFFLHVLHGFGVHLGSDTGFSHLVLSVPNRSHPLQHPKRTRLRLFSHEIGCVSLFLLVFGHKIFDIFFVHSADMVHKPKSLVIPLSRDVSFLT